MISAMNKMKTFIKILANLILFGIIIICYLIYKRDGYIPTKFFVLLIFAIMYYCHAYFGFKNRLVDKYTTYVGNINDINLQYPKLKIKKSTIESAGNGVFAQEFIPKGTIFQELNMSDIMMHGLTYKNTIAYYINDLAYTDNVNLYEQNILMNDPTNISYVCVRKKGFWKELYDYLFQKTTLISDFYEDKVFLKAIRDIQPGEELSKHYGVEYWQKYEEVENWKKRGEIKRSI